VLSDENFSGDHPHREKRDGDDQVDHFQTHRFGPRLSECAGELADSAELFRPEQGADSMIA
jgi:hypothetical protein